jgi:predicted DsbA family dithiol-disulfide isomerase
MNRLSIKIDVVSDVVCPWCYIGKRRLEKAMDQLSGQYDFEIEYFPFELNPEMPKAGRNQKEYLTEKFGSGERYAQLTQHVSQVAADEGLRFDYTRQPISPNTHDAHRLVWLARQGKRDIQSDVQENLMKAYFEEGVDLSQRENLVDIGIKSGLDEGKVRTMLDSNEGEAEVTYAEQLNRQRGIRGVPFFIINNQYGISGAQPTEVFVETLTQIANKDLTQA